MLVDSGSKLTPVAYTVAGLMDVRTQSAFAHFDGSAAVSDFLPALAFYSSDGRLISRTFPTTPVAAGDVADVSFAPFLAPTSATVLPTSEGFSFQGFTATVTAPWTFGAALPCTNFDGGAAGIFTVDPSGNAVTASKAVLLVAGASVSLNGVGVGNHNVPPRLRLFWSLFNTGSDPLTGSITNGALDLQMVAPVVDNTFPLIVWFESVQALTDLGPGESLGLVLEASGAAADWVVSDYTVNAVVLAM